MQSNTIALTLDTSIDLSPVLLNTNHALQNCLLCPVPDLFHYTILNLQEADLTQSLKNFNLLGSFIRRMHFRFLRFVNRHHSYQIVSKKKKTSSLNYSTYQSMWWAN